MDVQFVSTVAVVTPDPARSRALYVGTLGLPLEHGEGDEYYHSSDVGGVRHFGVWPLTQAAQACFGTDTWPAEHAVPQASVEFEVADESAVTDAVTELREKGAHVLHDARREPWGQTVARLLAPEGIIVGISYIPAMHD